MAVPVSLAELLAAQGRDFGTSPWLEITQERVRAFADATGDHQWIHLDEERAAQGPFGGTIAHGFLTLSLAPRLLEQVVQVTGSAATVNYGLDRLRFPAPLRVGGRVRAHVQLARAEEVAGGVQVVWKLTVEAEGGAKPVCVAEIVFRYVAA